MKTQTYLKNGSMTVVFWLAVMIAFTPMTQAGAIIQDGNAYLHWLNSPSSVGIINFSFSPY